MGFSVPRMGSRGVVLVWDSRPLGWGPGVWTDVSLVCLLLFWVRAAPSRPLACLWVVVLESRKPAFGGLPQVSFV